MSAAQRSEHPALLLSPTGGVLASLREQPAQLHAGVYWLSEVQQREKRTDGARYARLILDDAQGMILGLLWSEWLYQLADLRLPGPVFATGTLQGPSWDRILHVERLRPLRPEERDGGARLLPRRLCPPSRCRPWTPSLHSRTD